MKKIIALLTAISLIMLLASCGKETEPQTAIPEATSSVEETETEAFNSDISVVTPTIKTTDDSAVNIIEDGSETASESTAETSLSASDPSQWTKEEIVEFYKVAAEKSHPSAKSTQVYVINELILNDGDGALAFFVKILEPAIASVVEKNATEFDGITGGFRNLTAEDAQSVKAYKSGEYTVIEMTMKPQTDPIRADAQAGTVGHAISVLGDIALVLEQFPQFDVDVENADIDIHYVNPTVKVKINKDGIIEKGTWKYTCYPDIKNLDISGIMIKKADAKIDYIITVGGGF